jgi:hypothetical protein
MSLTLKTDVKNHLFARGRAQNHLHLVPREPNATGVSQGVPGKAEVQSSGFDNDFVGEHSSNGISIVTSFRLSGSIGANTPDLPESPQG